MRQIIKKHITSGVTWIEIKNADLFLCCGCPADVIKHLKKSKIVRPLAKDGWEYESGPNAILLSDTLIQNGKLANLSEFVILHMLYLQGFAIPNHPNHLKCKPLLIGYEKQLQMQMEYVSVGNHGLEDEGEIVAAGMSRDMARKIFATKLHYAGGTLKRMANLLEAVCLEEKEVEIKNGVFIQRKGVNKFQVSYGDEAEDIDLNLGTYEQYQPPYELPFRQLAPSRFSITHTGEGNGWDVDRPCMASIVHHEGKTYLIDAGPNILTNLSHLGIGLSEIEGIFLSHMHDDHFAGITELLNVEKKLKLFATPLIRKTAEKKLYALFNSEFDLLHIAFQCIDLQFDQWNDFDGLEVKPTYSPHTVETSIFKFRVRHRDQVKTYLHLADTINIKEFDIIIRENPGIFGADDLNYVKDNYLTEVDLKKLDVGGGAIHGHLSDYASDKSRKLVMAHTSHELDVSDRKFVNATFGDSEHLIQDEAFDFLGLKSIEYLNKYFETIPKEEQTHLANGKIVRYAPDEHIGGNDPDENIFLILSGLVKFKNDLGMEQRVDAGNFIGSSKKYFLRDYTHQYVSLSHVVCLQFKQSYIDHIFAKYQLKEGFRRRVSLANALRDSFLVQYMLSGSTFYELAGEAQLIEIPDMQFSEQKVGDHLFILMEGSVTVLFENSYSVEIFRHQHFGGLNLLTKYRRNQRFLFSSKIKVVAVPIEKLTQVPVLLWKLIELEEKRYQLSIFETK
jgi:hemerythrin